MDFLFEYGYWGLFIASFAAATILPFSSEGLLILMLASGKFDVNTCVLIASLGNWMGGITSYYLGYIGNWKVLEKYFGISEDKLTPIHSKINKYGSFLALFSWLPVVGDVVAIGLGFFKTNFLLVSLLMFIGKFLRYAILGAAYGAFFF